MLEYGRVDWHRCLACLIIDLLYRWILVWNWKCFTVVKTCIFLLHYQVWGGSQWSENYQLLSSGFNVIFSHVDAWYLDCGFGSWRSTGDLILENDGSELCYNLNDFQVKLHAVHIELGKLSTNISLGLSSSQLLVKWSRWA